MSPPSSRFNRWPKYNSIPPLTVLLVGLALTASSCRLDPVAPLRSAPAVPQAGAPEPGSARGHVGDEDASPVSDQFQVPVLANVRGEIRGDSLYVRARTFLRGQFRAPRYDPDHAGGWALQLFVDADPSTGDYWLGYESIVRGVEWNRARGTFVTRAITLDAAFPGGWGPARGEARFRISPVALEVAIPLSSIGGAASRVNFALETYATVACVECDAGFTHEFADDYFGSAVARGAPAALIASAAPTPRLLALRGHTAAADSRLAHLSTR